MKRDNIRKKLTFSAEYFLLWTQFKCESISKFKRIAKWTFWKSLDRSKQSLVRISTEIPRFDTTTLGLLKQSVSMFRLRNVQEFQARMLQACADITQIWKIIINVRDDVTELAVNWINIGLVKATRILQNWNIFLFRFRFKFHLFS